MARRAKSDPNPKPTPTGPGDGPMPITEANTNAFPCKYARFKDAVPTKKDKEPVYEFKLESNDKKYVVDLMVYGSDGLLVNCGEELVKVPLGNIVYVRPA